MGNLGSGYEHSLYPQSGGTGDPQSLGTGSHLDNRRVSGPRARGDSKSQLRLLIDARKLLDGGIGRYTMSLLEMLADERQGEELQVTALINPEHRKYIPERVVPLVTHQHPFSMAGWLTGAGQIPWGLFDVFHSPHIVVPVGVPIPTVVTVHDIIPVTHPLNWLHQRITAYMLSRLRRPSVHVLTVSAASAQQLSDVLGIGAQVVPNVLPFAVRARSNDDVKVAEGVPYVVGVFSNRKPHKGQRVFAEACAACGIKGIAIGKGASVIEGYPGIECRSEMSWEELLSVYLGARALVVSSRVEGFCLPAMEAKALGIRIVSTPEPAVCELLDGNDEVASDFTAMALAQALRRALDRTVSGYLWDKGELLYPAMIIESLKGTYKAAAAR
jgi:glycosyltransferase involved in cell wall biosynthesis